MLKVFRGLYLIVMSIDGVTRMEVTPLNPVQEKILTLLEQSKSISHRSLKLISSSMTAMKNEIYTK